MAPGQPQTFICAHCGESFEFAYRSGRRPIFCSGTCKARARRRRERARQEGFARAPLPDWPAGSLPPSLAIRFKPEPLHCATCGRPLSAGENFAAWRVRTGRRLRHGLPALLPICPVHYGETARYLDEEP